MIHPRLAGPIAALALLVVLGSTAWAAPPSAATAQPQRYYLVLGDDLGAGYQPNGDSAHGYAADLRDYLRARKIMLTLVSFACVGETAAAFAGVAKPACASAHSLPPQMSRAEAFLRAHRAQVALVTITIGSNDLTPLRGASIFDLGRVTSKMKALGVRLNTLYGHLRAAAGPRTPIMTATYYNPAMVGNGSMIDQQGVPNLNGGIKRRAAANGLTVAAVDQAFAAAGDAQTSICTLTWYCSKVYPQAAQPNTAGYAVIARAFTQAPAWSTVLAPGR